MHKGQPGVVTSAAAAALALVVAAGAQAPAPPQGAGSSDPSFSQPSIPPGIAYTVPAEAEIVQSLGRIREHFVRSTPYRLVDTATGQPLRDVTTPTQTAGIDLGPGEFNDWTYSMGVVLAGMLHATDVTGDRSFESYTRRNFDFIFEHLEFFRRQAAAFGPQPYGYRRLMEMRELDDCGAIGAALIKAYLRWKDPKYRPVIDLVNDFVSRQMTRMPDRTIARARPHPVSIWVDDLYMSVPFLAQMGALTGQRQYFDDAATQVVQYAARLMNPNTGLFDHSWFAHEPADPKFYWGRGGGWALMATAELLSVMPEQHPRRAQVLDVFRRGVQGVAGVQSGSGFWHQLLDREDSYLESSATAMFTFAIARGVNRGWIQPVYAPIAQTGWRALETRIRPDGTIDGIVVATTAAYDAVYYYNRPTDPRAMQGFGAALMAGAEVLEMIRRFDIQKTLNTYHYRPKKG
ncbi:MAG TPA: glycoside hydrolase family 88 protein [Vicinamibacterales bacterium]|nr:glycoside hydrolase family 88 protein [Vicinamibacterales bacterium]